MQAVPQNSFQFASTTRASLASDNKRQVLCLLLPEPRPCVVSEWLAKVVSLLGLPVSHGQLTGMEMKLPAIV